MPNNQNSAQNITKIFFNPEYNFPFILLLVLLVFTSLRPDLLIPGGKFLVHFPTVLLGILLLQWISAKPKTLGNTQTKLLLFFVALALLHLPFVRNSGYAFMIVKGLVVFTLTSYLFRIQFIDSFFKLNKYLRLYYILAFFFVIVGIVGQGRVLIPLLDDENDFCLFVNTLFPLGYFLGVEAETVKKKLFYFGSLAILVLGIVESFSRGGVVGFAAVAVFVFWKSKQKIMLLIIALVLAVTALSFAPQKFWDEVKTITPRSHEVGTGRERVESWKAGWNMFLDHPVVGVGPANFGPWLPDYWISERKDPERMWGRVAHSLYFTLLPEMGLLGTLLFLGVLKANYKDHRYIYDMHKRKEELLASANLHPEKHKKYSYAIRNLYHFSQAISGAMIAYLATGLFISILWYGYFWLITSFVIILANLTKKIEEHLVAEAKLSSNVTLANK